MSDRTYEERIAGAKIFTKLLRDHIYNGYSEEVILTVSIWLSMRDVRDLECVIATLAELEAQNEVQDLIIRDMRQLLTPEQLKEYNEIRGHRRDVPDAAPLSRERTGDDGPA